ncbi:MAG: hypothetical protein A2Z29_04725 [Chloroflexi bacterium RBG_16_56_11]|nr:MAG: hypothetical protein A2Z29_04725 [Chloroflexi bacterium RBG_16_56_11]
MDGTEVKSLTRIHHVYYDVYGDFPATGLFAGDLAYATDRLIMYRWDGAAWQPISIHVSSGLAAAIPAAAALPDGSVYYETDSALLKVVSGGAWSTMSFPRATVGNYTGNSTANRAIPHGIGVAPKIVLITRGNGTAAYRIWQEAFILKIGTGGLAVTVPNATNFYVGNAAEYDNSANYNTAPYYWMAIS